MHDIGAFAFAQDPDDQPLGGRIAVAQRKGPVAELVGLSADTPVLTCDGPIAVRDIAPGARVHTRDNGIQPVLWSGRTDRAATRDLQAVVIPQETFGSGRDLCVAPHQGVLVNDWRATVFFGEPEILIQAKGLSGLSGIHRLSGRRTEFYQILLPEHALIQANGSWTESLHPEDVLAAQFGRAATAEIAALDRSTGAKSVPMVTVGEARALSG